MTHQDIVCGDACALARAFEPHRPTVVITDPIWPNRNKKLFPGVDAHELLHEVLEQLVGKVSHVVLQVGCMTDPRFMSAVPSHWPYWRTCWMRYSHPTPLGMTLMGSDVAYVFGEPRRPTLARVAAGEAPVPSEWTAAGKRGRGRSKHPCPRDVSHARWLVRWFSLPGELVLDPFAGKGTTLVAAKEHGRDALGWENVPEFCELARTELAQCEMFDFHGNGDVLAPSQLDLLTYGTSA